MFALATMRQFPCNIRRSLSSCAVAAVFLGNGADPVSAALSYSYHAGAADFTAATGTTIQVPIYVREIVTSPSISLLVDDGGLYSGGVAVSRTGFTGSSAGITSITGNTASTPANGGFSGGNSAATNPNPSTATLDISVGTSMTGAAATNLGDGEYRVLLGTLLILASTDSGISTFSLDKLGIGTTMTNIGRVLDTTSNDPHYSAASASSFTVTTLVPEPSSLLGLCALMFVVKRRRPPC